MSYTLDKLKFITCTPGGLTIFYYSISKWLWQYTQWIAHFYRKLIIPHVRIVSVIGSLGKTTTTRALQSTLLAKKPKQNPGNARNSIAENILRISPASKVSIIETAVGGPGQMAANSRAIRPNIVVVTSVKSEHNRSFKTIERTRQEKGIIVKELTSSDVAVLNGDDPNVMWMAKDTRAKIISYGFESSNDIRATQFELNWPQGSRFKLIAGKESRDVEIKLLGRINVYPILASVAVGIEEGVSLDRLIAKLEQLPPTEGRMEIISLDNGVMLIDDSFKGTLESYYACMDVMEAIKAKRKLFLMGNIQEPPGKQGPIYKEFGMRAAQCIDKLFFIGSVFPRIKSGLVHGGMDRKNIVHCGSRWEKASELLKCELRAGDVLLIKGRADQKFRRIVLKMLGKDVKCSVQSCDMVVDMCDRCPFFSQESTALENDYLKQFVKVF